MARTKKHKHIIGTTIVLGCVVILLGFLVFFDSDPEQQTIQSDDGVFSLFGDFPSSLSVSIVRDAGASTQSWTAIVGDVYVVNPDGVQLPQFVDVRMRADGRSPERTYAIAYFDSERGYWTPLVTRHDTTLDQFSARTNHFSHWALVQQPAVTIVGVDMDAFLDEALRAAPPGATAYRVDVAYATVDGDYVLHTSAAATGRCAESATMVEQEMITSRETSAPILVGDVELQGIIRAIVTWNVGTGCADLVSKISTTP
ncbi:hypothetical protein A3C17_04405 [Candidatus Uhrbacteria bacterium RIFCSPHIGHO2_02_FULL_53_13]|uniref:Uncharacterized protein n=2 Tax=Candidatus Uhriibacteriota TaxID=1752732 RepID=A0A1F7TZK2_9BACT|nr:MAG: hypothetical protein A3C17_04405 [Candidatus Uhrbacteria bacterium RIFCSPHIGHO2_02_FULL_53_13]OGL90035.1 MAG: hypothetical protein A3I45_00535 [Candidatus Uhrbacteria bacterium RIFCSPLOWO2_02_FULL_53_10]